MAEMLANSTGRCMFSFRVECGDLPCKHAVRSPCAIAQIGDGANIYWMPPMAMAPTVIAEKFNGADEYKTLCEKPKEVATEEMKKLIITTLQKECDNPDIDRVAFNPD